MNYDTNGKYYFYNANHESLWDLPPLFTEYPEDIKEERNDHPHFSKVIDQELPTLKNLYSRISVRRSVSEASAGGLASGLHSSINTVDNSHSHHNPYTTPSYLHNEHVRY